jgi:hypothetical protein
LVNRYEFSVIEEALVRKKFATANPRTQAGRLSVGGSEVSRLH